MKIYERTKSIPINRAARQCDTLSTKLFNHALENIFKRIDLEEKGITICGQRLDHLRYAEDIVLITDQEKELFEMMKELDTEARKIGY